MMRWDSFSRSLVFAAVAAAAWLPWIALARPLLGGWYALVLYLGGLTTLYVAGSSAVRARAVQAALAAAIAAAVVGVAARTATELALGLAAVLGLARGGLYPSAPARVAARELILIGGGLLFARFLAGAPLPSVMLAVWGFLLVQSCFFLLGAAARPADGRHPDAFEEAHRRATALLDAS